MTPQELRKELNRYLDNADKMWGELKRKAKDAEETDDYYDYDQACYDTWEYMADEGGAFAKVVQEYLEGMGE